VKIIDGEIPANFSAVCLCYNVNVVNVHHHCESDILEIICRKKRVGGKGISMGKLECFHLILFKS